MNDNLNEIQKWEEIDADGIDFDQLENNLDAQLEEQLSELQDLEIEHDKIGNPDALGETIKNVVWEQFLNQIGVQAGEDFIKENRDMTLDLRDSAHIQTGENFEEGKIAEHNYISNEQLEQNYDRFKNKPHKEFRDEYVDPGMDKTLKRAGELHKEGVETVTDIYTGRQIPTHTKLEDGKNNPQAAQREHVKSSDENYKNPSLQMANSDEELAAIINDPENLQGYTTAERNNRKSNNTADKMEDRDKNKHWEKANKRAEEHIKQKEKEGEERLKAEGRKTQKEEAKRIGGTALRAVVMALLADLIRDIIRKLVEWFRTGKREFKTFIEAVKGAIHDFITNIKEHLRNAGNVLATTIATAIVGPVVGVIKKAWILLKQGYNSVKNAIKFLKDPANKNMPFSIKMLEVGKIVIAGLTAGGAIVLGEVIEKGLLAIPVFATPIPLLGSLANILGLFFGALVSGIIGALALDLIDRIVAKKQKRLNEEKQIEKKNEILATQGTIKAVAIEGTAEARVEMATGVYNRHEDFHEQVSGAVESMKDILIDSDEIHKENQNLLGDIDSMLDD